MKANIKQIITVVIILTMISGIIYCFTINETLFPKTNVWNSKESTEVNNDVPEEEKYESNIEDKTYQMGEECSFENYVYKVNHAKKTKVRGDFPTPTNWQEILSFDNEGNLIDDKSYLVVNITIKNKSEEIKEIYLNNNKLLVLNDDDTIPLYWAECISSSKLEGYERKDYFRVELNPLEEYTWDLVYPVEDNFLKYNNFKLEIYRSEVKNIEESNDKTRYIKIKFQ